MSKQGKFTLCIVGFLLEVSAAADPIQILNSSIAVTSDRDPYWPADRVNDGILNIQFTPICCRGCAALQRPSWVQLTLDKTYLVEKILVLGRIDIHFNQFDNITLLLGRQDQSLQNEAFTSNNRSYAMTLLAPPREVYRVRVSGEVLSNIMTTNTHMTICEIMIYRQADCLPGKYSANCSRECHCLSGPCESVTGTCMSAVCQDGWRGLACNETCSPGTFGNNCSSICHCYDNVTCHHIDGTCPDSQCAAGWTRDNCSVACTPGFYGQSCAMDCHCDTCHHDNGSCVGSLQCHDGFRMENGFCTPMSPHGQTDKYYNAILAVSSVLGVVVAAGIVLSVLIIRRKHLHWRKSCYQRVVFSRNVRRLVTKINEPSPL
ncbi:uncharacterized protein LOC127839366 isoform X2 [Dreissena polymorpha]|uniref:uncharacterized protein LOC127839366 isoform X2 n=1 Tax=Dreissena polymorpha TaxID=45954 RepID=UPI0022652E5E|nr:uncharacterized protein LOC127839366 isoform X2 [Dreissena polymorpha]XP_052223700.1 uncharacterized protein LOC127839366 isoform X2 [Dreissena polymorpha]